MTTILKALEIARQHVQACAEYDLDAERRQTIACMYGSAAECRKQYEMRLSALKVIDAAIALATEEAPLRERLCTPMTVGQAAIAASTVR